MLTTVLFDLDNTLIGNPMDKFLPAYLSKLADHTKHLPGGSQLIDGLLKATRLVVGTEHPDRLNHDVVIDYLERELGWGQDSAETIFNDFYATVYPQLQPICYQIDGARAIIEHCFAKNLRVVIATNPLFPQAAIEGRLSWAGIPVTDFDYALVTHSQNMHAAKPAVAYYVEILGMVGVDAESCLMVGDDWKNDMLPATSLGMKTWFVPTIDQPEPLNRLILSGYGALTELMQRL